jgi:hypothetical protein
MNDGTVYQTKCSAKSIELDNVPHRFDVCEQMVRAVGCARSMRVTDARHHPSYYRIIRD